MLIGDVVSAAPVIPVIVLEDAADAVPLARALLAGGLPVLEVTLRPEDGLYPLPYMSRQADGPSGAT